MKKVVIIFVSILFFSCLPQKKSQVHEKELVEKNMLIPEFQKIIDVANLEGAILVYDLNNDKYYSNNFKWIEKGFLPASTFKIVNSIIALETGVVANDSTLLKWNGEERRMDIWKQDLILKDAFHYSCVPCYQKIAREIGAKRMNEYVNKLNYGAMQIDETSIDLFWLVGDSKINQIAQIEFLKRFYKSELLISKETESIMKRLMVIEETDTYKICGKTGWSIRNGTNNGWFVGYVTSKNETYFFATNIMPKKEFEMNRFSSIRKEITYKALRKMNIIK